MITAHDPRDAFIDTSVWHGPLEGAEAILAAHPEVASSDIYTAAILGDDVAVRRFLSQDPARASEKGGPRGWDALTYLCFSRYLRLDPARSTAFVRAATALLDAGASAATGFFDTGHQPEPEWKSALYGAAGVAHHARLTRLLLERGADPNDNEVPYHAPETTDNAALRALVESNRLTQESLATMLLRKADWHDRNGIAYLLQHGADPNRTTVWGRTGLQHAVLRDNAVPNVERMLEHGGDPTLTTGPHQRSALVMAARRGRADLLRAFAMRGFRSEFQEVDRLIAACAMDQSADVRAAVREPRLRDAVVAQGGTLLAEFAGNGNVEGLRHLLDLGVIITAPYEKGDAYFGIAPKSTALHVAAWRAQHAAVQFLIERGAPVDAPDGAGRTPLVLAVGACVDSYWTDRRSPRSVAALLAAGASIADARVPSGYAKVDALLRSKGAGGGQSS
jgi:ankyrin repeat protein